MMYQPLPIRLLQVRLWLMKMTVLWHKRRVRLLPEGGTVEAGELRNISTLEATLSSGSEGIKIKITVLLSRPPTKVQPTQVERQFLH